MRWTRPNSPLRRLTAGGRCSTADKYLTVEYHQVEWPNGKVIDDWAWVHYAGLRQHRGRDRGRAASSASGRIKYALRRAQLGGAGRLHGTGRGPADRGAARTPRGVGLRGARLELDLGELPRRREPGDGQRPLLPGAGGHALSGKTESDDLEEQESLLLTAKRGARRAAPRGVQGDGVGRGGRRSRCSGSRAIRPGRGPAAA